MANELHTSDELNRFKRYSAKLRIIAVSVTAVIILCIFMIFNYVDTVNHRAEMEKAARIEAANRQMEAEQAKRDSMQTIEDARQRHIADSVRIANMPSYSIADVHEMVREVVPTYSWVYLWRMDNDNWIMQYTLEYGDKEHHFIQRFNPSTRKFEKAIEFSTTYYKNLTDDEGIYTHPANVRCSFSEDTRWGTLEYFEDGKRIGEYNRRGIEKACRIPSTTVGPLTKKRIKALKSAPPEWVE